MEMVWGILLQTGKIIAFLFIILSLIVSWIILFRPETAGRISQKFNRWISTNFISQKLETQVDTTEVFMKNRFLLGGVFFFGALFTFKYMAFEFDAVKFVGYVIKPAGKTTWAYYDGLFTALQWFLVVCSLAGMVVCLIILFSPSFFEKLNNVMNRFTSTASINDALDAQKNVDSWVLRNHVAVGLFLFLGSCYLVAAFLFSVF